MNKKRGPVRPGECKLNLPLKVRLKLLRQDALSALQINGHQQVRIAPHPLGAEVSVIDGRIIVPSPLRWKLYRKGWQGRLDQLQAEYGVGRHVALSDKSVVLDIGANAGEFAHVCARYGARVYCAEPDDAVRACLVENIAPLKNATTHNALMWKEIADVPFTSVPTLADSSVFGDKNSKAENRRATTVEAFCSENGVTHIDLLKCDAEGAEPEVLQGIGAMFPNIAAIALDTGRERRGERTHEDCRKILEAHGFTTIDESVGKRLMTYGLRG